MVRDVTKSLRPSGAVAPRATALTLGIVALVVVAAASGRSLSPIGPFVLSPTVLGIASLAYLGRCRDRDDRDEPGGTPQRALAVLPVRACDEAALRRALTEEALRKRRSD